jgi:hypothetical protein
MSPNLDTLAQLLLETWDQPQTSTSFIRSRSRPITRPTPPTR